LPVTSSQSTASLQGDGSYGLLQQLLDQLSCILQARSPLLKGHSQTEQTPIENNHLSVTSPPVQSTTAALEKTVPAGTCQTFAITSSVSPSSSLPKPVVPPIPLWMQEKKGRGEYIDF